MKKLYFLGASLLIGAASFSQSKLGLAKGAYSMSDVNVGEKQSTSVKTYSMSQLKKLKKAAFFSEDFSNGFAGQGSNGAWTQSGTPSSQTGVVPMWEYRGPATTPDNTVGSRGSCAGTRGPIESETVDNGFLIFDSNYWDEPAPDMCAGAGTGLSPRPHQSALVSPSIDMSAQTEVQLFFTTFSRNFQASVNLSVIADGDTTFIVDIYEFIDLAVNVQTAPNALVGIDITDAAAGKSDVRVVFDFVGDYYYFSFDDVFFDEIPDYDYNIVSVYNDDITEFYEYYDLPESQSHVLTPGFQVLSRGTEPVNLELEVTITEPDGTIQGPFTQTLNNFPKDSLSENIFIPTFMPDQLGEHIINFKLTTEFDSLDLNFANNERTRRFVLTENKWSDVFSANRGFGFFAPVVDGAPGDCEQFQTYYTFSDVTVLGMEYSVTNDDRRPDEQTFGFDEIELAVYEIDKAELDLAFSTTNQVSKAAAFTKLTSEFVELEPEMLGLNPDFLTNKIVFEQPVVIPAGTLFAIAMGNSGGGYLAITTTSPGTNTDGSGLVRARGLLADPGAASDDDIFNFSNVSPWMRATVDKPDGISENRNAIDVSLSAYPNPANNETTISYNLQSAANNTSLIITDLTGKVVYTATENNVSNGVHRNTIATNTLNSGMYFVTITVDGKNQTQKLVINKQ